MCNLFFSITHARKFIITKVQKEVIIKIEFNNY